MAQYKITNQDFEFFKKECDKWVKKFGLTEWVVEYYLDHDSSEEQVCHYWYNLSWKQVTISLASEIYTDVIPKKRLLADAAFHEVCELVLVPLRALAKSREFDNDKLEDYTHTAIHHFAHALFGKAVS